MPNYDEPKGRANKKSDKAKKNFELHGKNTQRGVRFMETVLSKHGIKNSPPTTTQKK